MLRDQVQILVKKPLAVARSKHLRILAIRYGEAKLLGVEASGSPTSYVGFGRQAVIDVVH